MGVSPAALAASAHRAPSPVALRVASPSPTQAESSGSSSEEGADGGGSTPTSPAASTATSANQTTPPGNGMTHADATYLAARGHIRKLVDHAILTQPLTGAVADMREQHPPLEISVAPRRGMITVLQWGSPPFAIESMVDGSAFIPHGFRARTWSNGVWWVAETKVEIGDAWGHVNKILSYRFVREGREDTPGPWEGTASAAYHGATKLLLSGPEVKNPAQLARANGKLIIGVMYKAVQSLVGNIFHHELAVLKAHIERTAGPDALNMFVRKSTVKRQGAVSSSASKKIKGSEGGGGEVEV